MRLQDNYDWLVLGSHPGALLTASLVAKLGLSVLMLPLGSQGGVTLSSSGQILDPEPNYLLGVSHVGKVEGLVLKCLTQLGATSAELDLINTENSIPQVLTLNSRFALFPNDQFALELQREYGKGFTKQLALVGALKQTEAEYLSYWQNLPRRLTLSADRKRVAEDPMTLNTLRQRLIQSLKASPQKVQSQKLNDPMLLSWLSRRETLKELSSSLNNPDFHEAARGLWYAITSHIPEDPALFDVLHLFNLSRTAGTFKGGLSAYRQFLLKLAKRLGVQILPKTECRRLFINKGRFIGVQVTNRGNMISVGGGVLGCALQQAYDCMAFSGTDLFRRKKAPLKPRGWRMTIAMTVHRESIPAGMLSRVFWQESDAPILEIEVLNPKDYGQDRSNEGILNLRTVMPFNLESLKPEFQRLVAGRMLRQAVEIMPFLEFHVTRIYPDFRMGRSVDTILGVTKPNKSGVEPDKNELIEAYGFPSLEAIPENLLVYSGEGVGSSTGIDGLFIASDESYPQLGSLGSTVAALESVAWLAHRSGFPGPLA